MGDRGNIVIDNKIWLYTHSDGSSLKSILKAALKRGQGRWTDRPYLTRIIFSEMIKDDILGDTGYGIDYIEGDGGTEIYINSDNQTIDIRGNETASFEEFITGKIKVKKIDKKKVVEEFEDTIEQAELRALSTASLERQLTDKEFNRMKTLSKKIYGG